MGNRAPTRYVLGHAVWAYDALVRTCFSSVRGRPQHPALPLLRLMYDPDAFAHLVYQTTERLRELRVVTGGQLDWVVPTTFSWSYDRHGHRRRQPNESEGMVLLIGLEMASRSNKCTLVELS